MPEAVLCCLRPEPQDGGSINQIWLGVNEVCGLDLVYDVKVRLCILVRLSQL